MQEMNAELLRMICHEPFDEKRAAELIKSIPDLNEPIFAEEHRSTYLFEAQRSNNIMAASFLLRNGADPNLRLAGSLNYSALSDLSECWYAGKYDIDRAEAPSDDVYLERWCRSRNEAARRLKISELFFQYGGDPNLQVYGETLYDRVLSSICEGSSDPLDEIYLMNFLKLLVAYGGGGGASKNPKAVLTEQICTDRITEYSLSVQMTENGDLTYRLLNPEGIDIGRIR